MGGGWGEGVGVQGGQKKERDRGWERNLEMFFGISEILLLQYLS